MESFPSGFTSVLANSVTFCNYVCADEATPTQYATNYKPKTANRPASRSSTHYRESLPCQCCLLPLVSTKCPEYFWCILGALFATPLLALSISHIAEDCQGLHKWTELLSLFHQFFCAGQKITKALCCHVTTLCVTRLLSLLASLAHVVLRLNARGKADHKMSLPSHNPPSCSSYPTLYTNHKLMQ